MDIQNDKSTDNVSHVTGGRTSLPDDYFLFII